MKKIITIFIVLATAFFLFFPRALKYYGEWKFHEPTFPTQHLPIEKPVTIYLNEYQVPYIDAQTDSDLAFTIGLVHAHYRLPQMEISRLIAKGELSKMLGPIAHKIDHTLRIIQFDKAADEIIKRYPPETKIWLERYVEGINYYIQNVRPLPWDLKFLQITPEPWTLHDLVAGFRMASSDVNWVYMFLFLAQSKNPEWEQIWDEYIKHAQGSVPSAVDGFVGMQESGSNSLVVGGSRTKTGSGMIANDPHVSIVLPSLWFMCGYNSPSYHTVGITIPGVPVISFGRNENIAWGATNMYSVSSFLFELKPSDMNNLEVIEEKIPTRFGLPKKVKIRNSIYGPVLTDSPYIHSKKPLALYWMGHQPSDEISAFLGANRAKNWKEFEQAFYPYSVLGLNYVYTDKEGNVGYVPAYRQPLTKSLDKKLIFPTEEFTPAVVDEGKLQRIFNPQKGYIATANNKPIETERDWGWFYAPSDRALRQGELVEAKQKMTVDDLKELQVDTKSISTLAWIEWLKNNTAGKVQQNELFQKLIKWNGKYDKNLIEPVIFELMLHEVAAKVMKIRFHKDASIQQLEQTLFLKDLVREIMEKQTIEERSNIILNGLEQIKWKSTSVMNWGQFHQMTVQYGLGYIPWIGEAFRYKTMPVSGSNDTLFKRAFLMKENSAAITYGSSARQISDLSDIDANYFVLFGSQNGYPFSPDNANQIDLWEEGKYIQMPLRLETVKKTYKTVLSLTPQ